MEKDFKKEYPNAKIKYEEIPWQNREQKIMTALSTGEGPDVFYIIPDMMTQFADKGILEPLNDDLSKAFDKSDFSKTSLKAVTYKDKMYGLPMLREVQTMIYNTDVLKKIGADENNLPKTWEEFDELAAKAKAAGYYARNFEGGNTLSSTLYPYIWQAGGDVIKDGKVVIDNKQAVKAFTEVEMQYKKGYVPEDSITAVDQNSLFMEGKMMSAYGTGYLISMLEDAGKSNYVIGSPLKEKEQVTFGVTGMFAVSKNSKNASEAAKFVETMTSKENMSSFCKLTKYIPARNSALDIYDNDEKMSELTKYVDIANPGVINPSARIFMPNVQAKLQAMLEGTLTPKQAAKEAAKMIEDELNK
jgi:multiple sugar transport system substrate-binding protein